ncbi:MAG: hypothetical protein ABIO70_21840 [Pseudomonadota bacterium]
MPPAPPRPLPSPLWLGVLLGGLAAFAFAVHATGPFLADDGLISLRYARHLLAGDGLVWNVGERVEGYSTLLWVLLCAGLGALRVDLVEGARALGLFCGAGTVTAVAWALRRQPAAGLVAGVGAAALSAPLAIWSQSGMEGGLVALEVALALALLLPAVQERDARAARTWAPGLALAALCLTRPEAPLLVAALAFGWWLAQGQDRAAFRSGLLLAGVPAAATLAQAAFRLAYYGTWLPNTAHAKLHALTVLRLETGVLYVVACCHANPVLWLAALAGLFLGRGVFRHVERLLPPLIAVAVLWVVFVGGDHFPAWRFLLPLVPAGALLTGAAATAVARRGRLAHLLVGVALVPLGLWSWHSQQASSYVRIARYQGWVTDQEPVGRLLGKAFGVSRPLLATGAAGGLPFWSDLPCLDILGLTDAWIAEHSAGGPSLVIGHEQGDTAYVLAREPDLVMFCGPRGGAWGCVPQEYALAWDPTFRRDYTLVTVRDPEHGFTFQPWARWGSARLGQRWDHEEVVIPAWMLASESYPAVPGAEGELVLPFNGAEVLEVEGVPLPDGVWSGSTDPPGAAVEVTRAEDGTATLRLRAEDPLVLRGLTLHLVWPD